MDLNLERLNKIYPNSKYVLISKYNPNQWIDKEYDSSFDSKAAINRWKTNPLSYEEAQVKVAEGYRIGWIIPKSLCVIDIDNADDERSQEYLEKLLHKFEVKYSYNYSSKGIHMLFRDPTEQIKSDSRTKCALNIMIDTRANETGYIVLPCNDPHRKWGQWNDYVEDVPYFLKPIAKHNTPSFIGLQDGDGRNNAVFKWRSVLEQSHKLTPVEIEKSIRIINENLFDTPMPNKELYKTVLRQRDEQTTQNAMTKENIHNTIAEDIIGRFDIVSRGDTFYQFNGTYYKRLDPLELEKIIHFEISKNINDTGRKEILKFIRIKTQVPSDEFDKDWYKIACKNGILNLVTGELTQPTKADINTIFIPYEYDNDPPYSPRIDTFMKDLCDGNFLKMQFLYQIAGYALLKKNLFEKFFIFKGEGGTGKSTYLNLLQMMVGGDDSCSHVSLAQFDKDYYLATTMSKLLNIDDDVVDGKVLEDTGRFKSIISGNKIAVRQIYQPVIEFIPYVTCVFNCNKLPRIMDRTSGLYRRIVLVELNHKVAKPDRLFMTKITDDDMRYFLFKAVEGIKQALEEGHFKIEDSEQQLLKMFKRRQSSINEWIYESSIKLGDIHGKRCLPLYSMFNAWCDENGYTRRMTMFSFKEELCALFDVEVQFVTDSKGSGQTFIKRGEFDPEYSPF